MGFAAADRVGNGTVVFWLDANPLEPFAQIQRVRDLSHAGHCIKLGMTKEFLLEIKGGLRR